ncbi:hypothetical protein HGD90_05070 [Rhodobacteraceae bacterium R_SAG7]|nr:hypothetical protein [Rhodobacteraceae bacterium R_SAG7]
MPVAAIQSCLSTYVEFKLPISRTVKLVTSFLCLSALRWRVPGFSMLCGVVHA